MNSLEEVLRKLAKGKDEPYSPSPDEFIPSMAIERFLADKNRILVVGDAMGRDYKLLTYMDKEVFVLDIVPQQNIPNFYQQSVTEELPFDDSFFDGVVLAEVIEHLFEDYVALNEIRRILKDDGVLVITVPYISNRQDEAPYHVRVHTRKTIERLLAYCGFRIEEHFYRGLICRLPRKNIITRYFVLAPRVILKSLLGDRGLELYRRSCFFFEKWIGSRHFLSNIQKAFTSYGGIMKVRKGERIDFARIQIAEFSNRWIEDGTVDAAAKTTHAQHEKVSDD